MHKIEHAADAVIRSERNLISSTNTMLVEFKVANFRSFKEEQVFSLVASKDETHPGNLINTKKFNLLKTAAIYGQNASGKSNFISAVRFVERFVGGSATKMNQGDPIPSLAPFRLDRQSKAKPSCFQLIVLIGEALYDYNFSATSEKVHDESLKVRLANSKREQVWLKREFDSRTRETKWWFGGPLTGDEKLLREKTRDNGLVLSRGAELNIKALSELFLWFRNKLYFYDLSSPPIGLVVSAAGRLKENKAFGAMLSNMIRDADIGIDRIKVAERNTQVEDIPSEIREGMPEKILKSFLAHKAFSINAIHHVTPSDAEEEFDFMEDESNGTKRFFALAGVILVALKTGRTMVVDEIECSMHPNLVRKLVELFQSPKANNKGAQLIFATHDSTLMDQTLLRRDQIWLVEKNKNGASQLRSLYDFAPDERPRNTEAFQRNYLAGRYGGVPKFGPIFEDFELK